jgi:hypothetical protein
MSGRRLAVVLYAANIGGHPAVSLAHVRRADLLDETRTLPNMI